MKQASFLISFPSKWVSCHLALPLEVTLSYLANRAVLQPVKVDDRVLLQVPLADRTQWLTNRMEYCVGSYQYNISWELKPKLRRGMKTIMCSKNTFKVIPLNSHVMWG